MLTFEGQKFQGSQAIGQKLAALPFNQCKVTATSMDFQPSVSGGIIVFVTGSILVSSVQARRRLRGRAGAAGRSLQRSRTLLALRLAMPRQRAPRVAARAPALLLPLLCAS